MKDTRYVLDTDADDVLHGEAPGACTWQQLLGVRTDYPMTMTAAEWAAGGDL